MSDYCTQFYVHASLNIEKIDLKLLKIKKIVYRCKKMIIFTYLKKVRMYYSVGASSPWGVLWT